MKRISSFAAALLLVAAPLAAQTNYDTTQTNPNQMTSPTDQNNNTDNMDNTRTDSSLPSTASPLGVVAACGLLSLGTGVWLTRRRRSLS
jgi:hypothetical protein